MNLSFRVKQLAVDYVRAEIYFAADADEGMNRLLLPDDSKDKIRSQTLGLPLNHSIDILSM